MKQLSFRISLLTAVYVVGILLTTAYVLVMDSKILSVATVPSRSSPVNGITSVAAMSSVNTSINRNEIFLMIFSRSLMINGSTS
jgi:hypothetical protein